MAHIHTRGTSASRDGGNERKASDNGIKPCKNHALHILSFPRLLWSLTLPLSTVLRSCLEEPCGGATTAATSLTHLHLTLIFIVYYFWNLGGVIVVIKLF